MFFKEIERRKNLKELINDICETVQKNNIKVSYIYIKLMCPEYKELKIYEKNKPGEDYFLYSCTVYSYEQHGFAPPSYPKEFARKLAQQMGLHFEEIYKVHRDAERYLDGYSLESDEYIQELKEREMKKNNLRRC